VQLAREAEQALGEIAQAVEQMRDSNMQIATAAEQQSQVAEEMTRSVIGIRDFSEKTVLQTRDSTSTSTELANLASQLNLAIGKLKL
jgi:methyl-accepting chemotaxis protein